MLGILEKKVTVSIIYVVDWYNRTENCTIENCPMIIIFGTEQKTGVYKKISKGNLKSLRSLSLIFSFNIY